ncbi:hypothetical protein V6Z93_007266 [Aspergillus fumigatus]
MPATPHISAVMHRMRYLDATQANTATCISRRRPNMRTNSRRGLSLSSTSSIQHSLGPLGSGVPDSPQVSTRGKTAILENELPMDLWLAILQLDLGAGCA